MAQRRFPFELLWMVDHSTVTEQRVALAAALFLQICAFDLKTTGVGTKAEVLLPPPKSSSIQVLKAAAVMVVMPCTSPSLLCFMRVRDRDGAMHLPWQVAGLHAPHCR